MRAADVLLVMLDLPQLNTSSDPKHDHEVFLV